MAKKINITNAWLRANNGKPVEKPDMIADRDGLNIRISKKGTLTFTMRYRHAGKPDQMALGTYPEMSLAEAREKNLFYRAKLAEGISPKTQKEEELKVNIEAYTFEQLFFEWFKKHIEPHQNKHSADSVIGMYNKHVADRFAKRLAKDIVLSEWLDLIEGVQKEYPASAARTLSYIKQAYKFGVVRELVEVNPVINISAKNDLKIKDNVRKRYLEDPELRKLLNVIDDCGLNRRYQIFTLLCLFYGCRPAELRQAKKDDFNFDTMVWTVPAENHKTGKKTDMPLIRPIIPEIVPILKELFTYSHNDLAICGTTNQGRTGKNYGKELSYSFFCRFPTTIDIAIEKKYGSKLEKWAFYDLRKTMRTNMGRIGSETKERIAPFHVSEMMLGHTSPGSHKHYDMNDYLDAQREAYSTWWARMERIKADADNVKVVNFG